MRLKPTNPYDEHTVAIVNERGIQMGYASADSAPLIGKQMKEGEVIAVLQAMHKSGTYIWIRFGGEVLTLPDPVPAVPKRPPPRKARLAQRLVYDPTHSTPTNWARVQRLTLVLECGLTYVCNMKPSKFIPYYERLLGRALGADERVAITAARGKSVGKRDAVKAMRVALLKMVPDAHAKSRIPDLNQRSADYAPAFHPGKFAPVTAQEP